MEINDLSNRVELMKADLESLPMDDKKFDACIMIAALHHLPDRDSRIRALDEAWRCTRPYGKAQISVWRVRSRGQRFTSLTFSWPILVCRS